MRTLTTILAAGCVLMAGGGARADEGMWTFDAFPTARMQKAYGFAPDQSWLDHVRLSAARLTGGCSSSVVSSDGLVLTNHHCVVDCAQNLSTPQDDYVKSGFLAADRAKERKCPGQQAEILTAIVDVTPKVTAAIGQLSGEALVAARTAAVAAIESEPGCKDATVRCQVVTLFGGGQYKLYRYRKYSDVRLVFAPEYQVAQFGGDPDNFNFPRFGLDAAFLRLYEDGRPVSTPDHLKWVARAPRAGEVVFAVGNPGSTQRLYTQSQMAAARDLALPTTLLLLSEWRGRLIAAMADDPEKARTGADTLFGVENSFKAVFGMDRALLDPEFAARLAASEQELRAKVDADPALKAQIGDPWAEVAKAQAAYRDLYLPYTFLERLRGMQSSLYDYAVTLVRAAEEREKPDGERLPQYTDSHLPLLKKQLVDERPVYPWLEKLEMTLWLSKVREYLGADDPAVKALLGRQSPEDLGQSLTAGSKLADAKLRERLFDGGMAAVKASDDPMIKFVLATDPQARAVLRQYRAQVDGPVTAAQSRLARARFAVYGEGLYPDATFTLRITYGPVEGWMERGRAIAPTTTFAGQFDRATGQPPFDLSPRWLAARASLDPSTVLDFSAGLDATGGNSGSPVVDRDGAVIGALFDGNIHSLGGAFGFDPALNRSVIVSTGAVEAALKSVYPAPALVAELHGGR
jgi:hypothetical protein